MNALLALLLTAPLAGAQPWFAKLDDAVADSKARARPILVDFQAPWCYSCYYMEQRVLSRPGFAKAAQGFSLAKLDVDTAEGASLKEKSRVSFLPTYLVLAPGGDRELGRIIGEQTEADFLAKLSALTAGGKTGDAAAEDLRARVGGGNLSALRQALGGPAECDAPYLVEKARDAVARAKEPQRRELLALERAALEDLAERRLFVARAGRCADFRSGVEALAELYADAGETAARAKLLDRAVAQLRADQPTVGEDRNRDDNLRFFLELRGDEKALKALYESLLRAYPSDYVYAFRWARHLLAAGKPIEALPVIEKADKLSYGANRLAVTGVRARILAALGRRVEAVALARRDLDAGQGRFPAQEQDLRKTLVELSK